MNSKKKLDTNNCEKYVESKKLKFEPKIRIKIILIKKMKKRPSSVPGKIFLKILKEIFLASSRLLAPITCNILTKLRLAISAALTIFITKKEKGLAQIATL